MSVQSGAFALTKGANVALRDFDEELGSLTVVLETVGSGQAMVDADVSVLLLGADGRVRGNGPSWPGHS